MNYSLILSVIAWIILFHGVPAPPPPPPDQPNSNNGQPIIADIIDIPAKDISQHFTPNQTHGWFYVMWFDSVSTTETYEHYIKVGFAEKYDILQRGTSKSSAGRLVTHWNQRRLNFPSELCSVWTARVWYLPGAYHFEQKMHAKLNATRKRVAVDNPKRIQSSKREWYDLSFDDVGKAIEEVESETGITLGQGAILQAPRPANASDPPVTVTAANQNIYMNPSSEHNRDLFLPSLKALIDPDNPFSGWLYILYSHKATYEEKYGVKIGVAHRHEGAGARLKEIYREYSISGSGGRSDRQALARQMGAYCFFVSNYLELESAMHGDPEGPLVFKKTLAIHKGQSGYTEWRRRSSSYHLERLKQFTETDRFTLLAKYHIPYLNVPYKRTRFLEIEAMVTRVSTAPSLASNHLHRRIPKESSYLNEAVEQSRAPRLLRRRRLSLSPQMPFRFRSRTSVSDTSPSKKSYFGLTLPDGVRALTCAGTNPDDIAHTCRLCSAMNVWTISSFFDPDKEPSLDFLDNNATKAALLRVRQNFTGSVGQKLRHLKLILAFRQKLSGGITGVCAAASFGQLEGLSIQDVLPAFTSDASPDALKSQLPDGLAAAIKSVQLQLVLFSIPVSRRRGDTSRLFDEFVFRIRVNKTITVAPSIQLRNPALTVYTRAKIAQVNTFLDAESEYGISAKVAAVTSLSTPPFLSLSVDFTGLTFRSICDKLTGRALTRKLNSSLSTAASGFWDTEIQFAAFGITKTTVSRFEIKTLTKNWILVDQYITVRDLSVAAAYDGREMTLSAEGQWFLGSHPHPLLTTLKASTSEVQLGASIAEIPIGRILSLLGESILASDSALKKKFDESDLSKFSIEDFNAGLAYADSRLVALANGNPSNLRDSTFEIMFGLGRKKFVAFAFVASLPTLVREVGALIGQEVDLAGFKGRGEAALVISSSTETSLKRFEVLQPSKALKVCGGELSKGVTIAVTLDYPSDCTNKTMCGAVKSLLGPVQLAGMIQVSTSELTLSVELRNIKLFGDESGYTLTSLTLALTLSRTPSFWVEAELEFPADETTNLTLNGKLAATAVPTGVEISGTLGLRADEPWKGAFKVPQLVFELIEATLGYNIATQAPSVKFAARAELQNTQNSSISIRGAVALGISVSKPRENYFKLEIHNLTFGQVMRVFTSSEYHNKLPTALLESGYKEVLYSVSLMDVEEHDIKAGARFVGHLVVADFFEARVTAEMTTQRMGFSVSLEKELTFGGVLSLKRSASDVVGTDKKKGPIFSFSLTYVPFKVDVLVSGQITVCGVTADTFLRITNTDFTLKISAKRIWGFFTGDVTVQASYGSLSEADFSVDVNFSLTAAEETSLVAELWAGVKAWWNRLSISSRVSWVSSNPTLSLIVATKELLNLPPLTVQKVVCPRSLTPKQAMSPKIPLRLVVDIADADSRFTLTNNNFNMESAAAVKGSLRKMGEQMMTSGYKRIPKEGS